MIRSLLKIALILVVGILVYNRYFGTSTEKAQAKEVFGSVKGVVKSVAGIMRTEKDKFEAGKYDKVMDKLGGAYRTVRERAALLDDKVLKRLDNLEERKQALQEEINSLEAEGAESEASPQDKKSMARNKKEEEVTSAKAASRKSRQEKLQRDMEKLLNETEALLDDAEKSQE